MSYFCRMLCVMALLLTCGADNTPRPQKILYIYGDSLTIGSMHFTRQKLANQHIFHNFLMMPRGFNGGPSSRMFDVITAQPKPFTDLLVNTGLWDMNSSADTLAAIRAYRQNLTALFEWCALENIHVWWRQTTATLRSDGAQRGNDSIDIYNGMARELAARYDNVTLIDINPYLRLHPELYAQDGVHLANPAAYEVLADLIVAEMAIDFYRK